MSVAVQRTHYQLSIRLDGSDSLLLWYTDDAQDGVVATPDEHVLAFVSETALLDFALQLRVTVSEHRSAVHDLDVVQAWACAPSGTSLDPRALLAAWNFFGDVARSVPTRATPFLAEDAGKDALYDKLFLASKPEPLALSPAGATQKPEVTWTSDALKSLASLMNHGLALLRAARVERR